MQTVCILCRSFAWKYDGVTDVIQFTGDGHGFMQRVSWVLVFPLSISFFNSPSAEMSSGLGWWLTRCLSPSNFPQSVTEGGRMWEVWLSISSVFLPLTLALNSPGCHLNRLIQRDEFGCLKEHEGYTPPPCRPLFSLPFLPSHRANRENEGLILSG